MRPTRAPLVDLGAIARNYRRIADHLGGDRAVYLRRQRGRLRARRGRRSPAPRAGGSRPVRVAPSRRRESRCGGRACPARSCSRLLGLCGRGRAPRLPPVSHSPRPSAGAHLRRGDQELRPSPRSTSSSTPEWARSDSGRRKSGPPRGPAARGPEPLGRRRVHESRLGRRSLVARDRAAGGSDEVPR